MSRTELRALALIGAAALGLRLGAAVLTRTHPLFPAYYYADARLIDGAARADTENARAGRPYAFNGTLSQKLQVRLQVYLYRAVGIHPFAMQALNCVLGAAAVVVLGAAVSAAFGAGPALGAAALCALWPSNVFYTSQNFKEAPSNLLVYLALTGFMILLSDAGSLAASISLSAVALMLAGFYRGYVLLVVSAAAVAACAWRWTQDRRPSRQLAAALAVALAAPAVYLPVSRAATDFWLAPYFSEDVRTAPQLIPFTYESETTRKISPLSLRGLSETRRLRQNYESLQARSESGRDIATLLFPNARFESWFDVLGFLPKSSFYVLFMPLPGLYPLDGKLGRIFASAENLFLLILACLGVAGAVRGPKMPARVLLLLFFLAMTAGSALLEFDLGSAGRHKLLYLPLLFPFAVEEALRLLGRKESA